MNNFKIKYKANDKTYFQTIINYNKNINIIDFNSLKELIIKNMFKQLNIDNEALSNSQTIIYNNLIDIFSNKIEILSIEFIE